ncbi:hypothetical protein IAG25_11760 [Caballeronia sp. EK]|jgi:hypothetical protein|uniref:Uncharacterized protein n=1 Tax=Caballeronia novacaledonica TaxID=1544861 RepID=A0AA37MGT3_9BURK|nr:MULTISPECIES: hypothetical protein [Caballeronia]MBC8637489.1 hypothetical protein [Caballeronia sp. EK]GJH24028.1 hypothetical protein CBA19CS42_05950 [Caballeronia novacaledonica]
MEPKKIGRMAVSAIPPREKIAPKADRDIDMSTPESRERVSAAVRKIIQTHNIAIKALAKR